MRAKALGRLLRFFEAVRGCEDPACADERCPAQLRVPLDGHSEDAKLHDITCMRRHRTTNSTQVMNC